MNKEFIPYNESLELKELGFDERCFGHYWEKLFYFQTTHTHPSTMPNSHESCLAPTFSQAFRWFRERYGLFYDNLNYIGNVWKFSTYSAKEEDYFQSAEYKTYEEAELACLVKLIEIAKQK